jgi:hypothetical protein
MEWELGLVIAGTVMQLFGAAITIKGARQVWKGIKGPDDRFLAPITGALRKARSTTVAGAQRATGRQPPTQSIAPSGIPSGEKVGMPAAAQGFPPLPTNITTDAALRALDERLREVQSLVRSLTGDVDRRLTTAVDLALAKQERMKARAEEKAREEQRRAVRGLRTEAYGFLLLTLGTLIQTGGTIAGLGP